MANEKGATVTLVEGKCVLGPLKKALRENWLTPPPNWWSPVRLVQLTKETFYRAVACGGASKVRRRSSVDCRCVCPPPPLLSQDKHQNN